MGTQLGIGLKRDAVAAMVSAIAAAVLSLLVFAPILSRINDGWSGGDLLSTYINAEMWQGFRYRVSDQFGFPLGMNLNYFPGIDITENLFAQLITIISGQPFTGINLLIIVSFPITAFLAYFLVRMTGLSILMSVTASLVVTFLPYHLGRALGHTYLSTMYSLITGLILVILIGSGRINLWFAPNSWRISRNAVLLKWTLLFILVIVTAWTGVYYAAFTLILGVAAILWRFAHGDRFKQLAIQSVPMIGILLAASIGFLPGILTVLNDPPLAVLSERLPYESVIFAGLLVVALLPLPLSNIPGFGFYNQSVIEAIRAGGSSEATAMSNYGTWITSAALGVFLIGIVVSNRKRTLGSTASAPVEPVSRGLIAYLLGISVLFFIPWGLNYLVAGTLTAQIRAWNRLTPVLLILFILGAAVILHTTRLSTRPMIAGVASFAIIGITAVDAILPFKAAYASSVKDGSEITQAAREYSNSVNAAIPESCGVIQIPFTTYPEYGAVRGFNDYDHFWVSLLNPEKKWSYGAVRNTSAGIWSAQMPEVPSNEQLRILTASDFCGIHLDTRAYTPQQLRRVKGYLSETVGAPLVSGFNDKWLFYSMNEAAEDSTADSDQLVDQFFTQSLITADPVTTQPREVDLDSYFWWMKEPSTSFTLTRQSGNTARGTTVRGTLLASPCGLREVQVTLASASANVVSDYTVRPDAPVDFTIEIPSNEDSVISFTTDPAPCTGSDFVWQRYLQISDLRTY